MLERHLFKAKRKDSGEWVFGGLAYCEKNGAYFITKMGKDNISYIGFHKEVYSNTICQCTGLKDKNGRVIWENDIVMTVYDGNEHIYQVVWDESELDFKATNGKENYKSNFEYLPCCDEIEILGNCFDNPELLEV